VSEGRKPHWHVAPYFLVADVEATADWYREKLGFQYERFWGEPGEPPQFTMVRRAGMVIMLSRAAAKGAMRPNHRAVPDSDHWDAYVWVDDADALLAEFRSRGVTIARDICDQPYRCRDFDVEDCNGFRLCFGHDTGTDAGT
jgi:predicted enzyme related to lactoylglutathione lyase